MATNDVAQCVIANDVVPHERYDPLWNSIIVEEAVKTRLLRASLLALTVRAKLPFHVTALHGLAVLAGPPGTGKSTLARGLASQIAEATNGKARLIEVNPHGLMSGEHGRSQQRVHQLLAEHIPALADDHVPTVVLLDEIESMAVARGAASLEANPADVHRATDAVLTALDDIAATAPHIFIVATSNFTEALDDALLSRADITISVPLPEEDAVHLILQETLIGFSTAYPELGGLADDPALRVIAAKLAGYDGRRVRKFITEAMQTRAETTVRPGQLTMLDLDRAATVYASQSSGRRHCEGGSS